MNVTIRPRDLPYIYNNILKLTRKGSRLFKKCIKKRNTCNSNYDNFKRARKDVKNNLRRAKKEYGDSLANTLKTSNLSSQDYWKTLKSFIKTISERNNSFSHDNIYVADNDEKANLLNNYFAEQTVLDDHLASLPELVERGWFYFRYHTLFTNWGWRNFVFFKTRQSVGSR